MSHLVFYEKPGCVGNDRQKDVLETLGHQFEVRDLLSEKWTEERLRPFFGTKPVDQWFNLSAPAIKSGEIEIDKLKEEDALAFMIIEPLLICRPLMEFGVHRQSGFLKGPVLDALGVPLDLEDNLDTCPMIEPVQAYEVSV